MRYRRNDRWKVHSMGYDSVADIMGQHHSFSRGCLPNSRNHAKFRQNLTLQQFKVTQGHRSCVNRKPIYDFLLVTNLVVCATVVEILTLKSRKSMNFLTPTLVWGSARGNPLEFGDEIWRPKTRILGLPGEIMTLAFFVLTQSRRVADRLTDRQTHCDRY